MDILIRNRKKKEQPSEKSRLSAFLVQVRKSRYQKGLMRHFEWPLVIMVLLCQKRIVSGMVDGAVKG